MLQLAGCSGGTCPRVWRRDEASLVIQGYRTRCPGVVAIPAHIYRHARDALGNALITILPDNEFVNLCGEPTTFALARLAPTEELISMLLTDFLDVAT